MYISQYLSVPLDVFGHHVRTLEDAAYHLRQYVINQRDWRRDMQKDLEARRLVRRLRDATSLNEVFDAEDELRSWLRRQAHNAGTLH